MTSEQTREILKKVRQIEIRTNRLVTDTLAGQYHSVFKGRGMNFDAVREYVPGDEVRTIDWNVTARAGRPFVKKFVEERELTLLLMVDVSASGDFGSGAQSKRELAAEIASVLAFSAVQATATRSACCSSPTRWNSTCRRAKGRRHVLRIVREVLGFEPQRRGTESRAGARFRERRHRAGARSSSCSRISRLGHRPESVTDLRRALRQTNRRHDLVALPIEDARERLLPDLGIVAIEDAETGELIELDTRNPAVRQRFAEIAERPRHAAPARLQRRGRRFAPPRHRPALRRRPHGLLQKPHPQTLMKTLFHRFSPAAGSWQRRRVIARFHSALSAYAAAIAAPAHCSRCGRQRRCPPGSTLPAQPRRRKTSSTSAARSTFPRRFPGPAGPPARSPPPASASARGRLLRRPRAQAAV